MAILFSVVARQNIVLARHADCVGNFAEVTEQLLSKIESGENVRKTYSHGRYLYHYVCYNGLIFMCIAGITYCLFYRYPHFIINVHDCNSRRVCYSDPSVNCNSDALNVLWWINCRLRLGFQSFDNSECHPLLCGRFLELICTCTKLLHH